MFGAMSAARLFAAVNLAYFQYDMYIKKQNTVSVFIGCVAPHHLIRAHTLASKNMIPYAFRKS